MVVMVVAKIKNKKQIGVFIDGANFWNCQKKNGWRVDFYKLKKFFYSRGFVKDFYYFTPEMPHLETFLEGLSKLGYIVVKKPIKVFRARNKEGIYEVKHKGNLDIEMAITIFKNIKESKNKI